MTPTKAHVKRPSTGRPDEVHLFFGGLPSPTSSTKHGVWMTFKAVGGTGDKYCMRVLGMHPQNIKVEG